MCCSRLHFSDFNVLFFKKIKNLLQFTFEKNNLLCKKREKITCREENSQPPPPEYQMVCPLGKRTLNIEPLFIAYNLTDSIPNSVFSKIIDCVRTWPLYVSHNDNVIRKA